MALIALLRQFARRILSRVVPTPALIVVVLSAAVSQAFGQPVHDSWTLLPAAEVDSQGLFFFQAVQKRTDQPPPHVRLADPPVFGQSLLVSRDQILAALRVAMPDLQPALSGPAQVRVSRRARPLAEPELKEQLTAALQNDIVRDKGQLELRFTRAWRPVAIPDEPFTLQILDLPTAGVTPNFAVRFQLRTARELIGPMSAAVHAQVWKEVWVARSQLERGAALAGADVARERRDLLGLREPVLDAPQLNPTLELAASVPAGTPLFLRSVRARPVVHRGQIVDAQFQNGPVLISLKVEVLQEGAPGDSIRIRNIQSRRELRGKVHDEQTIHVLL